MATSRDNPYSTVASMKGHERFTTRSLGAIIRRIPMSDYVYAYQAALWCEACGEKLCAELPLPPGMHPDDEHTWDSDEYPKGPYRNSEADCPHYCDGCGEFLENDLTADGYEYVRESITHDICRGRLDAESMKVWADFYGVALPPTIGNVTLVNPGDRDWTKHTYILAFGAYGNTLLMLWANSLDEAFDEAIDWIADNAPGLLADEQVAEEYHRAIAEGKTEDEAREIAEQDITIGGNCGNYIRAWEWGIVAEDPSPEQLKEVFRGR